VKKSICAVRIFTTVYSLDRVYSYIIPVGMNIETGDMISVPFGNGNTTQKAIVVRVLDYDEFLSSPYSCSPSDLKPVRSIIFKSVVTERTQALISFICDRYFTTFYEAARLVLPPGAEKNSFIGSEEDSRKKLVRYIRLTKDEEKLSEFISSLSKVRKEKYIAAFQCRELIEGTCSTLSELSEVTGLSSSTVKKLIDAGILETEERREYRNPFASIIKQGECICERTAEILTDEQQSAFDELKIMLSEEKPSCALLYGVTGSGKTKVMLKLVDEALAQNKGVIMLVPEIALTGQVMRQLLSRYGDNVAVLHSALSDGERYDEWSRIASGEKKIVLGTRSAIFAPCKDLGLIIMDEEQDHSYKSDSHARYHARDIARYLCGMTNSLLLLASATPDIESYYKAQIGKYKLLNLTKRYGSGGMPAVETADVRNDFRDTPGNLIGKKLHEAISTVLKKGEQAILFVNRRGYNRFIMCRSCSEPVMCPNCSVSLTYHKDDTGSFLFCHYCGYKRSVPKTCPSCKSEHLMNFGFGTQQLEVQIKDKFPEARILRLDADTVTRKNAHDKIISSFRNKEADILIGTQMVAKGHDFPGVSLVGIIMADSSLYSSDFRAKEQSFSLFTQVIGRAGRADVPGTALIQTFSPFNETLMLSSTQDYIKFYRSEIALRKALLFPPFCDICVIEQKNTDEGKLDEYSKLLMDSLSELIKNDYSDLKLIVYGPFEAYPYKLNQVYRKKTVIKFKFSVRFAEMVNKLLITFPKISKGEYLSVDINPTNI